MLTLLALLSALATPKAPVVFPIVFHVSEVDEALVVDEAWIDAEVARASDLFRPHGVIFQRAALIRADGPSHLKTRADRDGLGAQLRPGVINCFIVAELGDIHEPGVARMGVHWRVRPARLKHLVIISADAVPTVLAHELGHFFGNPKHSTTPGNIMSYNRRGRVPFFDAQQGRVIRAWTRRFQRTREIIAVTPRVETAKGGPDAGR
ncbi:hypothetical protein KKF91_07665 [Myxococcota bacterium]|nr:hypothetical protein [Myxococcota bacterium]MBU1430420.1 hypothetical protein [Myxococcota bacterium]MBU1896870.1 hypothetical protein [Myxococcota bacterium]